VSGNVNNPTFTNGIGVSELSETNPSKSCPLTVIEMKVVIVNRSSFITSGI
jgi:hypothetical protein